MHHAEPLFAALDVGLCDSLAVAMKSNAFGRLLHPPPRSGNNRSECDIANPVASHDRLNHRIDEYFGKRRLKASPSPELAFVQSRRQFGPIKRLRGAKRSFALIASLRASLRDSGRMPALGNEFAAVLEETWNRLGDGRGPLATKIHAYMLTQAVLGVLRDAALNNSKLLEESEFEEALFRMVSAFGRNAPRPV